MRPPAMADLGTATGHDAPLRQALIEREMVVEHRLNWVRTIVLLSAGVADAGYAWLAGTTSPALFRFSAALAPAVMLYLALVHHLSRGPVHRPWLKYLTVTADYALTVIVFFAYQWVHFFGDSAPDLGVAEFVGFLMLLNVTSALRPGRAIILYSTTLATAVGTGLVLAFTNSLALVVYSPLFLLGSGLLSLLSSSGLTALFLQLRRRERLMRFLPRALVQRIDAGEVQVALGGSAQEVTILLSDLRRFTTLAESRDPYEVVMVLNQYFTAMTAEVWARGGMVDKFIGDAVLAVFGAPVSRPDAARHAAEAALAMHRALAQLNRTWTPRGWPALEMGIALHTGSVIAGNVGSPERMEYTIIGDAVNVTARIEELNKVYGTRVLLSAATQQALGDHIPVIPVAEVHLRGRHEPIRLFTLSVPDSESP
jgi:adenylate cyclase